MSAVPPATSLPTELRRLAALAWPVVLGQLGMIAMGVVDVVMLGRISEQAIAASGLGNTWSFGTLVIGLGTAMGIDPLVSQAYGAGDAKAAGRALLRGTSLLLALSVPIMALHWWSDVGLRLLQEPASLVPGASIYCRIMTLGVLPFLGFAVLRQFLQGSGAMRPAMYVLVAGNVLNVFINDALIFGRYGLPRLEIAGAATATVTVRWVMLGLLLAIGWPILRRAWPEEGFRAVSWGSVLPVGRVALPAGWQVGLEVWAFGSASIFAGWVGETALAAHTVALSIISVLFMVPLGVSAAASTRVGNLVGARQPWMLAAQASLIATALVMSTWIALLLAAPVPLVRAYTSDPDVIVAAIALFPIAAAFQLFDGTQVVAFGLLRGLGDTRRPAWFNIIGHYLLGLPIGCALAFVAGWGLAGLWIGLSVGLASVSVLLLARLRWHAGQPLVAPT